MGDTFSLQKQISEYFILSRGDRNHGINRIGRNPARAKNRFGISVSDPVQITAAPIEGLATKVQKPGGTFRIAEVIRLFIGHSPRQ